MISQNLSVFLEGKARLIFENCPIRVIFNQRQGLLFNRAMDLEKELCGSS